MTILHSSRGITLVELLITVTIVSILASAAVPFTRMTAQRIREVELKRNLRIIRTALDEYKKSYDTAVAQKKILQVSNRSGYPKNLELLVEGDDFGGLYLPKRKFLRRIPPDPVNNPSGSWGLRSYFDAPDSSVWGKEDVYDVYSLSEGVALDGSKYKDW